MKRYLDQSVSSGGLHKLAKVILKHSFFNLGQNVTIKS